MNILDHFPSILLIRTRSPILFFAEYSVQPYLDGSRAAMCLTKASNGWTFTFFLMTISLFFVLPLVILVVLYAIIARNLIASDRSRLKIRLSKPELSHKARKQVVLMLGAVVLAFFTCLLPFRVLTLWIILVPEETFQQLAPERYYNLLYFSRIMLYLNSAVNPILYNLMSSKFRKGFLRLCSCADWAGGGHRGRKGRTRSTTLTTTTTTTTTTTSSTFGGSGHAPLEADEEGGLVASSLCPPFPVPPFDDERTAGRKKHTLSLDDLRSPRRSPLLYRINLVRQYSSPLLVFSTTASSPKAPCGHARPQAPKHRPANVTFDEPLPLLAAAETDQLLLALDGAEPVSDPHPPTGNGTVRHPLRLKFPRFGARRTSAMASPNPRASTMKQLSLDESLLTAAIAGTKSLTIGTFGATRRSGRREVCE
ncbi:AGAP002881-PA-like protein [Anopheles sinensis]|uniref:Thyrotropin-releasing hormone receptor n=1 Tax=Anopheles sinensis TaxID=74873 RepID=A0A084VXP3_ANOSI|nr:AGAP002881-PA-like protein [Anopheles sinensis]